MRSATAGAAWVVEAPACGAGRVAFGAGATCVAPGLTYCAMDGVGAAARLTSSVKAELVSNKVLRIAVLIHVIGCVILGWPNAANE